MTELLIMAACLLLNALLSGIEMAFVSVGKPQLRELTRKGNKEASRVLALRDNPERTLSVLQVGITLVGVLAAAVGGAGAEEAFAPFLEARLGLSEHAAEVITILGVAIPYTYLSVVLGELVPKSLALRNPTQIILKTSRWLAILDSVLSPVVTLLEISTRRVLLLVRARGKTEPVAAPDEVMDLESLTQEHRQYMLNLFNIRQKTIRDVMLPWDRVVSVDLSQSMTDVAATVHSSGHTRLPVVSDGEIVGVLHTKEFMALRSAGSDDWKSIIRPSVRVVEQGSLIRALRSMQESRSHLSIVFSGSRTIGIVTMEDIFEEIIGDIYDEDDDGRLRRILATRRERAPGWMRPPGSPPGPHA